MRHAPHGSFVPQNRSFDAAARPPKSGRSIALGGGRRLSVSSRPPTQSG